MHSSVADAAGRDKIKSYTQKVLHMCEIFSVPIYIRLQKDEANDQREIYLQQTGNKLSFFHIQWNQCIPSTYNVAIAFLFFPFKQWKKPINLTPSNPIQNMKRTRSSNNIISSLHTLACLSQIISLILWIVTCIKILDSDVSTLPIVASKVGLQLTELNVVYFAICFSDYRRINM